MYDILIKNGLVTDGTGGKSYKADIAIKEKKIVKIQNEINDEANEVIDAAGKNVTPGFIDIHRHGDIAVLKEGFGECELSQGLTTVVNGQCGLTITPCTEPHRQEILDFIEPVVGKIPEGLSFDDTPGYFDAIDKTDIPVNFGYCVGNGTLRMNARGFDSGKLTKEEMDKVHFHMEKALDAGALGVTMGIVYAPENCYDFDGFVEALSPMKKYNVPLVTHIRGYGDLLHGSLKEIVKIAKAVDVPLHVSHMMAVGKRNWGAGLNEGLAILDRAREDGLSVSCDVYPYTAGSSQLIQILPPWYQEGGVSEIVKRLKDKQLREELKDILSKPQTRFENLVFASGWDALLVTTVGSEKNQNIVGKTIAEIASERGVSCEDCAFDLLIEENCNVTMVIFITDENDILNIIRYPYSNIISDSVYPKSGLPHPRLYGSFPKVLSEYVRDRKVLDFNEVIKKMTSVPAGVYRMGKKGIIKEGYDADICVFDLDNIGCNASYTDPCQNAYGMDKVIVGGKITYSDGKVVNKSSGGLIRRIDSI